MKEKKQQEVGKINIKDVMKIVNAKGTSFSLKQQSPTEVKEWIPTGSKWLDGIIKKGGWGGIPVGKITEIAGLEASGKSFLAALIASRAQKMGYVVVYFDSESAVDPDFLERIGIDLDEEKFIYVQAASTEQVYETIEQLMAEAIESKVKYLFIHDSLANTATDSDVEDEEMTAGPTSGWAKCKVLTKAFKKITIPLANGNHALIVCNQLKPKISSDRADVLTDPYYTPGGQAPVYAYSLRIWLTKRKAKAAFVLDKNGYRIGSEVKVRLKKSRFGSEGRECTFKILWGIENPRIGDEDSWFEVVKLDKKKYSQPTKGWHQIEDQKFRESEWMEMLKDEKFKKNVISILEDVLITKFANREGNADDYYNVDRETDEEETMDAQDVLAEARGEE